MWEFYQELQSGNGPVFLKLDHLAEETIQTIEQILHTNERPSRGRFHAGRGTDYRSQMVEMHISEIGFCSGQRVRRVRERPRGDDRARLYAAGDMAAVPHNYMLGAFTYGWFAGQNAADYVAGREHAPVDDEQVAAERTRVLAPLLRERGLAPAQVEYKLRRMVNDYLQPPKVTRKMEIGLQRFDEITEDIEEIKANHPHELMRAAEVRAIRDCAEMAARASLFRTESRWGCTTTASTFRIATTPNGSATPGCARTPTARCTARSVRSNRTSCRLPTTSAAPTRICASRAGRARGRP